MTDPAVPLSRALSLMLQFVLAGWVMISGSYALVELQLASERGPNQVSDLPRHAHRLAQWAAIHDVLTPAYIAVGVVVILFRVARALEHARLNMSPRYRLVAGAAIQVYVGMAIAHLVYAVGSTGASADSLRLTALLSSASAMCAILLLPAVASVGPAPSAQGQEQGEVLHTGQPSA